MQIALLRFYRTYRVHQHSLRGLITDRGQIKKSQIKWKSAHQGTRPIQ